DRAIAIEASPATVFSWLCQLRVAPYSYDILDNFGRRSPRQRDPDLCHLERGQRFMTIFGLHSFVDAQHITLRTKRVAVTYAVRPRHEGTRLHVRVLFEAPSPVGRLAAAGDAVMMRKQLRTLKSLAEREASKEVVEGVDYDYADAFAVELSPVDARSPEQLFRDAVAAGRRLMRWVPVVHRWVLGFRLRPVSSPNHLFGWRIVASDADVIRMEAAGPLMHGVIVGRRVSPTAAVLTTYVVYVRRARARAIWALVAPLHRKAAAHVLDLAADASARQRV